MYRKLEITPLTQWGLFAETPLCVISGPCSAESEAQLFCTAGELRENGISVLRAGLWKPRTFPGSFEGVGAEGLPWLKRVKDELGMKVATEVANEKHVRQCLDAGVDMLWIGARTTANPFQVQEIADALKGTDIPVLVKNPINPDISLWIGALERLNQAGIRKLGVIHRGFSTLGNSKYRNDPQWQLAIELRSIYPQMPFFCDPSHISGDKKYIREVSQRALDLGLDGLMIESHCSPETALSDKKQQLSPVELKTLLSEQLIVRDSDSTSEQWRKGIDQLRAQIDIIDESILIALSERMKVSREIGRYKKENNVAILQTSRWDTVLAGVIEKGRAMGLSEDFISSVFNSIHEASVETQNDIISEQNSRRK